MIHYLHLLLPYLLLLYFVYRGLKTPLYFLGIPFLMFMGSSIFADSFKLFHKPGRLDDQLMFIWLIFLWILSKLLQKNINRKTAGQRLNTVDFCIIGLIILTTTGVIMTVTEYYPFITNVLREFLIQLSLFAGYFIIKDWISSNDSKTVVDFLFNLVIINSIAAVLFILHQGFHFSIYDQEEFFTDTFQGIEITRSFAFMPQFLFFSIIYLLTFKKRYSFATISLLTINLLAIVISYTRSSVIAAVILLVLYFVLVGLKNRKLAPAFKNLILYAALGIFGVFILSRLLPANTQYLKDRFTEMSTSQYTQKEPNDMEYRFTNSAALISAMKDQNKIMGMGSITGIQSPAVVTMKQTTADMVWSGVIFRWGFAGLLLFMLIYIFSTIHAFSYFIRSEGVISDLALLILLYIVSQIIESFVSWTFLSANGFATGLWYFALLSSLPALEGGTHFLFKRNEQVSKFRYS